MLHILRKYGNQSIHENIQNIEEARLGLHLAFELSNYLYKNYVDKDYIKQYFLIEKYPETLRITKQTPSLGISQKEENMFIGMVKLIERYIYDLIISETALLIYNTTHWSK